MNDSPRSLYHTENSGLLRDVEFIKIPLLLVFLPALSRQVFVA
ncbi:hypothetical protein MNBD_GAMMA18-881 [hydrothermal vent metagenome]|uniref:Uncharacterized protein n=1 Tax=hydrothermal vent metagenome TaxID=652676 RepID=A0A3B0ZXU9_9ZZZZ